MNIFEIELQLAYSHSINREKWFDKRDYLFRYSHTNSETTLLKEITQEAEMMFERCSYSDMRGGRFIQCVGREHDRAVLASEHADPIAEYIHRRLKDAIIDSHLFRQLTILLGISVNQSYQSISELTYYYHRPGNTWPTQLYPKTR